MSIQFEPEAFRGSDKAQYDSLTSLYVSAVVSGDVQVVNACVAALLRIEAKWAEQGEK